MDAIAIAKEAARGFKVLECEECGAAVQKALLSAGLRGQVIEIRAEGGRDFMVCLSYDEGQAAITQNGRHLGVCVGDCVFDNLHPDGLPLDKWLKDFDAIDGVILHSTIDF